MPAKINTYHKAVINRLKNIDYLIKFLEKSCYTGKVDIEGFSKSFFPSDYEQEHIDSVNFFKKFDCPVNIYKEVSKNLFSFYNGNFYIRRNKILDYHIFSVYLDNYQFYSYFLLEKTSSIKNIKTRCTYLETYCDERYKLFGNIEKKIKEITDLHVHMGGVLDFSYRLHLLLINPHQITKDKLPHELFIINQFNKNIILFLSFLENIILASIIHNNDEILKDNYSIMEDYLKNKNPNIQLFLQEYINKNFRKCPQTIYLQKQNDELVQKLLEKIKVSLDMTQQYYNPNKADKLINILFMYFFKQNPNSILSKYIFTYFTMRNIIKSFFMQLHRRSGYAYFSDYSRNKLKLITANTNFTFKSIKIDNIKTNVEIRWNIPKSPNELHNYFKDLHYIKTKLKKVNIKIIFHFLKKDKKSKNLMYRNERVHYKSQLKTLYQFLSNDSFRMLKKLDLAKKYFQGIDAASNELVIPPEVFAPIYRFFKFSILSNGVSLKDINCEILNTIISTKFTYHVGEEFRDIFSGLRRIFETLIFFDYKEEDRLGHAVALGINPELFLSERKQIQLSKGEYFDNLVFIYYILNSFPQYKQYFNMEEIENHIKRLGFEIYEEYSSEKTQENCYCFSIDDYVDAWLLRRNSPIIYQELKHFLKKQKFSLSDVASIYPNDFDFEYAKFSAPDFIDDTFTTPIERYMTVHLNKNAVNLWEKYFTNSYVLEKYSELCTYQIKFTPEQYKIIQDLIIEHFIAKKNIIVEILPTSNLLITPITTYSDHPFLRLHPPKEIDTIHNIRTEKVKIALGTDNPGIQGTNILMESYLIKEIVEEKYGAKIAEDYILNLIDFTNLCFR